MSLRVTLPLLAGVVLAAVPAPPPAAAPAQLAGIDPTRGGVVTLRAVDDPLFSFDFDDGVPATRFADGELILDDAEIAFDRLATGMLSVGFRTKELVKIVDIGDLRIDPVTTVRDVAPKPKASIFHSLTSEGGRFYYRAPVDKRYRLQAAERVFGNYPPEGVQHIEPVLGHVYVMRWIGPVGQRVERLVKFQVLELHPGQSVTLRWERL